MDYYLTRIYSAASLTPCYKVVAEGVTPLCGVELRLVSTLSTLFTREMLTGEASPLLLPELTERAF